MLDQLFGENQFRNEIVWKRSHAHCDTKQGMSQYGRICDYLFFYTKGDDWKWNPQYVAYSDQHLTSEYRHVAEDGRNYKETDVTAAKPGGDTEYEWRVKKPAHNGKWTPDFTSEHLHPLADVKYLSVRPYAGRYWAYSKQNMIELWHQKKLTHRSTGMPRQMQYACEMPGVPLQDLWTDIDPIVSTANERLGIQRKSRFLFWSGLSRRVPIRMTSCLMPSAAVARR